MSVKDNQKIFSRMYRTKYEDKEYRFEQILKKAILEELTDDTVKAELMATQKLNQAWNKYRKEEAADRKNGIVPLFQITNMYDKTVRWIGNTDLAKTRGCYYKIRPELYKYFDSLSSRDFELMACVVCEFLGADKVCLTPSGNEGGIDFFARIPFSEKSHFFFGVKGPIRIVGQCKKYNSKDNVGNMRGFITTLGTVYNHSYRGGEITPEWFKMEKGVIVGWHIAASGHQSGALDFAKNYGILVSESKQLIEIIASSKIIRSKENPIAYVKSRMKEEYFE